MSGGGTHPALSAVADKPAAAGRPTTGVPSIDAGATLKPGVTPWEAEAKLDPAFGGDRHLIFVNYGDEHDALAHQFADGSPGGVCGVFAKKVTGMANPEKGLWTNEVQPSVGTPDKPVQPGDVVVIDNKDGTFHAAVIASILPDQGRIRFGLTESSWGGDQKVHQGRMIDANDWRIMGFVASPRDVVAHGKVAAALRSNETMFEKGKLDPATKAAAGAVQLGLLIALQQQASEASVLGLYYRVAGDASSGNFADAAAALAPIAEKAGRWEAAKALHAVAGQ